MGENPWRSSRTEPPNHLEFVSSTRLGDSGFGRHGKEATKSGGKGLWIRRGVVQETWMAYGQYTCCCTNKLEMTGYHNIFSKNVPAFFVQFFVLPLILKHVSWSTFSLPKNQRNEERNPKKITISQRFSHHKKNESPPPPFFGWWILVSCFPWVPPPTRPGGAFCCLIELHRLLLLLLPHKRGWGFWGLLGCPRKLVNA